MGDPARRRHRGEPQTGGCGPRRSVDVHRRDVRGGRGERGPGAGRHRRRSCSDPAPWDAAIDRVLARGDAARAPPIAGCSRADAAAGTASIWATFWRRCRCCIARIPAWCGSVVTAQPCHLRHSDSPSPLTGEGLGVGVPRARDGERESTRAAQEPDGGRAPALVEAARAEAGRLQVPPAGADRSVHRGLCVPVEAPHR